VITRHFYRAQCNDTLMTLSVFNLNENIFLYYECVDEYISPEEIFEQSHLYLKPRYGKNS